MWKVLYPAVFQHKYTQAFRTQLCQTDNRKRMPLRLFWAQKSWTVKTFLSLTQELIAWHLENALIHILILKLQGYIFLRWQLLQFYHHPNKEILFSKHSPFIFRLINFFMFYIFVLWNADVLQAWLLILPHPPHIETEVWILRGRNYRIPSCWTRLLLWTCIKLKQILEVALLLNSGHNTLPTWFGWLWHVRTSFSKEHQICAVGGMRRSPSNIQVSEV